MSRARDGATRAQSSGRICFFRHLGASRLNPGSLWEQMNELLQFVVRHGYTLVFAWVFIEQAGLPVPSAPLLLAAGALSGAHGMNLWLAITFAVRASVASASMWYELGRRKGVRVLRLLCRISSSRIRVSGGHR